MDTNNIIAHAVTVQAWATVALSLLTAVLIGATIAYAVFTFRLVREAARQGDTSEKLLSELAEQFAFQRSAESRAGFTRLMRVVTGVAGDWGKIEETDTPELLLAQGLSDVSDAWIVEITQLEKDTGPVMNRFRIQVQTLIDELQAGRLTQQDAYPIASRIAAELQVTLTGPRGGRDMDVSVPDKAATLAWIHSQRT